MSEIKDLAWHKIEFTPESRKDPDYPKCQKLARDYGVRDRAGYWRFFVQGGEDGPLAKSLQRIADCGATVTVLDD